MSDIAPIPRLADYARFGEWLCAARTAKGLSQVELARMVGLSLEQMAEYEIGSRFISANNAARFATVFEIPEETLRQVAQEEEDAHRSFSAKCEDKGWDPKELPPSLYKVVEYKLSQIEEELKRLGRWQSEALPESAFENMGPFGMGSMSEEQWIQFVLIPRVHKIIAEKGEFPKNS